ncbi:MAG: hypothetical protein IJT98_04760 [Prevotella sp.]|nr:hypothetical protein [Prevotella sp.]
MKKSCLFLVLIMACAMPAYAQVEIYTEALFSAADGRHTPLWLNANKYGLSSLDKTNGYVRIGAFKPLGNDSTKQWKYALGADLALAANFTSTMIVQQLYGEIGWKKGVLTVGAKEQPLQLKNQELSAGSQTLGINARPVPGVRLELPTYWNVPGTKGFLGLRGHVFYGWTTDDGWQKDFTTESKPPYSQNLIRTENTMLHTKAGYVRLGKESKPLTVELGLEMGCQFGGTSYYFPGSPRPVMHNQGGLKGMLQALVPSGGDIVDENYRNKEGNHVGSWVARVNYDATSWGLSAYADHYFEDQSSMFFLDYDGFGTGEEWDSWEHFNWLVYDLRDIQLGLELHLKRCKWLNAAVLEYINTRYQSGPVYHDHTRTMPDHIGGRDGYYNHYIFTGWQHWGQVMGNPLYRSPLYNSDGVITVENNSFRAFHLGISGQPACGLHYRLLATWQKGWGNYMKPYIDPQTNVSLMAEADYRFPTSSTLSGWEMTVAAAIDCGKLLGDNSGMQLTVRRCLSINSK